MKKNEAEQKPIMVKGDDGRTYTKQPDGKLKEVYVRADEAKRMISAVSDDHEIQSVRISNGKDAEEPAIIVKFDEEESAAVMKAVMSILAKRTKG